MFINQVRTKDWNYKGYCKHPKSGQPGQVFDVANSQYLFVALAGDVYGITKQQFNRAGRKLNG